MFIRSEILNCIWKRLICKFLIEQIHHLEVIGVEIQCFRKAKDA